MQSRFRSSTVFFSAAAVIAAAALAAPSSAFAAKATKKATKKTTKTTVTTAAPTTAAPTTAPKPLVPANSVTVDGISPERCAANKKAGKITYLSGFDYAATASIVEMIVPMQRAISPKCASTSM